MPYIPSKVLGYDAFRPGQDQAIRSVCEGQKP